jgi:hypothetical protein
MAENNGRRAEYVEQEVPDYQGNPFIEALPPIWLAGQSIRKLTVPLNYHAGERELDAEYRIHCVRRLFRYFQPLTVHRVIEQKISIAIRQGYVTRNPVNPDHARLLLRGHEAIQQENIAVYDNYPMKSTAIGFTIIGLSGVGKTTAVERVLSLYPQSIEHVSYRNHTFYTNQLVWLKIDCPFDGSLKGLCFSFFTAFDKALGTDYYNKLGSSWTTVDKMLPRMAQISTNHGLGLLVVDEIQHLKQAHSGGSEKMLNFFVTLVNTIGVPVVLIGTNKAKPILQGDFRQARRGSGQGDLLWDRMENDISWETMLRAIWQYQWTQKHTELTASIGNTIYDESQGITDIAIKLYVMAQVKAITTGKEEITEEMIREAASEKFKLVKPMLEALRSGDMKKIARFEDISPIDIEDYISAHLSKVSMFEDVIPIETKPLEEQAVLKLLEMDIPSKQARSCVRKVLRKSNAAQPLSAVVKKAFRLALSMEVKETAESEEQESDLRNITAGDIYESIKNAGVTANAADDM